MRLTPAMYAVAAYASVVNRPSVPAERKRARVSVPSSSIAKKRMRQVRAPITSMQHLHSAVPKACTLA